MTEHGNSILRDQAEELSETLHEEDETLEEGAPARVPADGMDSEEKVRLMATAADSLRANDIVALDLRSLTIIADFFLICTGKSSIQIRSIADRIEERLRERGLRKLRNEGYQEATWILLDYGDVVAHVMAEEQRAFYNLEGFWSAASRLNLEFAPEPTSLSESIPSGGVPAPEIGAVSGQ